jgi:outer membrane protein insertion porin family
MKRLLFTVMLAAACGFAQSSPAQKPKRPPTSVAPAARFPIEGITVEGIRQYTREQVIAIAGLKIGQIAGKPEFERARDRLVACGAFETVSYKFEPAATGHGYHATFQLAEVEQVYQVRFEELGVSERDLMSALQAKDPLLAQGKLPATQPVLDRYVKWTQEYLAAKGIQEKIAGNVTPIAPGEFAVVFRPARNLPAVAQVAFHGNSVVPSGVLREAIAGVAIGSPYTEDSFRQMLNAAVRPIYETRGRVRVAFPEIRTEPAKDVQGVDVFVTVDEGQSYTLGKVVIDGPTPVNPDQLVKAGDFKTGDMANFDKVNEGLEKIHKALRKAGYMESKVTSARKIDDGKKSVDVTVYVEAGQQFAMGRLNIIGLDLDGEAEVVRIWTMKEGKPFNSEYPDFFLGKIREEGVFDNLGTTKSETKVNDRNHTVDVTLRFGGGAGQGKPGRHGRGGRGPGFTD